VIPNSQTIPTLILNILCLCAYFCSSWLHTTRAVVPRKEERRHAALRSKELIILQVRVSQKFLTGSDFFYVKTKGNPVSYYTTACH